MKELADGVWHIKCLPGLPWAVNAYLAGDVLIDAGCRQSTGRILKQLDGHDVTAHALTHAHPDHQGASHDVCEQLGVPFWCPEPDVAAAEDPKLIDGLPADDPVRREGEVQIARLQELAQHSGDPRGGTGVAS